MNAARVRMLRQWLGTEDRILAPMLGIEEVSLRNCERKRSTMSPPVVERLEALVARSSNLVEEILDSPQGVAQPEVMVFRSNEELWAAHPKMRPLPVGWHRMVIARAPDAMPEGQVLYPTRAAG